MPKKTKFLDKIPEALWTPPKEMSMSVEDFLASPNAYGSPEARDVRLGKAREYVAGLPKFEPVPWGDEKVSMDKKFDMLHQEQRDEKEAPMFSESIAKGFKESLTPEQMKYTPKVERTYGIFKSAFDKEGDTVEISSKATPEEAAKSLLPRPQNELKDIVVSNGFVSTKEPSPEEIKSGVDLIIKDTDRQKHWSHEMGHAAQKPLINPRESYDFETATGTEHNGPHGLQWAEMLNYGAQLQRYLSRERGRTLDTPAAAGAHINTIMEGGPPEELEMRLKPYPDDIKTMFRTLNQIRGTPQYDSIKEALKAYLPALVDAKSQVMDVMG